MNRRTLLKLTGSSLLVAAAWPLWRPSNPSRTAVERVTTVAPASSPTEEPPRPDLAERIRRFDEDLPGDRFLPDEQWSVFLTTVNRLDRVRNLVGHANFGLLGFDDMLRYARNYPVIGAFERDELDFMESVFATDARIYGFGGPKVLDRLTATIPRRETVKVPGTGNYLFRETSLDLYRRLRRDVGETLILTSGIRGVVKQMHLFLSKVRRSGGNLSRAARSLAPPGHSYHGVGDFDVGRRGLGRDNFTARFAATEEFRRLRELGYVTIRYPEDNRVGVRFEPWHVRVVSA